MAGLHSECGGGGGGGVSEHVHLKKDPRQTQDDVSHLALEILIALPEEGGPGFLNEITGLATQIS